MSEKVINGLKPEILWTRFYELSQVPRPSKKEEKVLAYLRDLFKNMNLEFKEDEVGNMVASVPATPGYENSPTVVLQGHVDMVCEKNKGTVHDFENDPIKLIKTDGWIKADGTTLGSDNGIGVAAALAVVSDKDAVHGPLEILLTIDEETGLTGANNLKPGFISGGILLNLDSEEDGAFYVGCSGGLDTVASFALSVGNIPFDTEPYELTVTGLKGGHSGLDIHSGRGNAIKILGRAFRALNKIDFSIAKVDGGSKRNAIPREVEAVIYLKPADAENAAKILNELHSNVLNELKTSDPGVMIEFKKSGQKFDKVFANELSKRITNTIMALPHGVITMSPDIPGLVETSTNVATIFTEKEVIKIGTSQRSSIDSANKYIAASVASIFSLADASVTAGDGYPGWKPNMDSQILKTSKKVFKDIFKNEPEIKAIHAGLECGILGDKNPGLDMVSFGPTIQGAHSPDERVNIETVEKFYYLLKGILKEVAENAK